MSSHRYLATRELSGPIFTVYELSGRDRERAVPLVFEATPDLEIIVAPPCRSAGNAGDCIVLHCIIS